MVMLKQAAQDDEAQPATVPEINEDLDAIEREAQAIEGAAEQAGQPVKPASTTAADLLGALEMVRLMAAPTFGDWPDFGRVWNDRTLQATAAAGGEIMDRNGWVLSEILSQWGPYIALVAAVGPAGLATYQHVQIRKAAAKERAARERTKQATN